MLVRPQTWLAYTVLTLSLLSSTATAQGAPHSPGGATSLAGTWRGTSICTPAGRPTCHDEVVVYHLRALSGGDAPSATTLPASRPNMEWTANKIVNGQEEEMGTLSCTADDIGRAVECPMRDWRWSFHASGDTIRGTLSSPAGAIWRNVHVVRDAHR